MEIQVAIVFICILLSGILIGGITLLFIVNHFFYKSFNMNLIDWALKVPKFYDWSESIMPWLSQSHPNVYQACNNYISYCKVAIMLIIILIFVSLR